MAQILSLAILSSTVNGETKILTKDSVNLAVSWISKSGILPETSELALE
ncbi:hypothetical protein CCACVL1_10725 [Corchorus capsularis]|uniref:Uncharacterized protein n=1 Tax=Corchorus capsularis TaxID=210143 RepID=A0A1R3IQ08_COCAP|nr:hypothetical protein CCACVL1_10725 [Corchorus capsularis]